MSNRSWFFASQGKQQGPYPEAQLHEFIASGTVTAETLVWSEGMAGWQKAGEIPGLLAGASGSPPVPQWGGLSATGGAAAGQSVSVDFSIWALLGRALLFVIGFLLVIPAPWTATSFYRWFIERLRVPQRPDLGFAGNPGDIWYVFVIQGLCSYVGFGDTSYLPLIVILLQALLSWMTIRWIVANISSQGHHLPAHLCRQSLGLSRLVSAAVCFSHQHHRVGVGDDSVDPVDLPQHYRHKAYHPVQCQWLAGVVADGGFRAGRGLHHPDSMGDGMVRPLVRLPIRAG
jgi:GYF domain 2